MLKKGLKPSFNFNNSSHPLQEVQESSFICVYVHGDHVTARFVSKGSFQEALHQIALSDSISY